MALNYAELRALATANERLVELFRWLDAQADIADATRGMDMRVYSDSIVVEQFVEGQLPRGYGVCYWLETRLQDGICTVEADVLAQTPDGQLTLRDVSMDVEDASKLEVALLRLSEDLWRMRDKDLESVMAMSRSVGRAPPE